jgi:uncharacterized membrane protein YvlD (DUF360 family)
LVTGFTVKDWWAALWFSIIVSIFTTVIEGLVATDNKDDKK